MSRIRLSPLVSPGASGNIDEVVHLCCKVEPTTAKQSRRLTQLDASELHAIWNEVARYIRKRLDAGQAVNLVGIGLFTFRKGPVDPVTQKARIAPQPMFIPCLSIEKILSIKQDLFKKEGRTNEAARDVNFSAVAKSLGLSRDACELGLREITFGLYKLLRTRRSVALNLPNVAIIHLEALNVRCRFLLSQSLPMSPDQNNSLSENNPELDEYTSKLPGSEETVAISNVNEVDDDRSTCDTPATDAEIIPPSVDHLEIKPTVEQAEARFMADPTFKHSTKFYDKHTDLQPGKHKHIFAPDRYWSDEVCPICRQESSKQLLTDSRIRDSDTDHLLDEYTYGLMMQFHREKKSRQSRVSNDAHRNAEFNLNAVREQHNKKFRDREVEKSLREHADQIERATEEALNGEFDVKEEQKLAQALLGQINDKRNQTVTTRMQQKVEERLDLERLRQELSESEKKSFADKLRKRQLQQGFLVYQINGNMRRAHRDMLMERVNMPTASTLLPPVAARNQSTVLTDEALQQRHEQAKKLYQEQVAMVRAKREQEKLAIAREKAEAARFAAQTQLELYRDTLNSQKAKYELRRNLEGYWREQMRVKQTKTAQAL